MSTRTIALPFLRMPGARPAAPAKVAPEWICSRDIQATFTQQIGFAFLSMYLFILYSRIFDIKLSSLHIAAVASMCVLLFAIGMGGLKRAFFSRIGIYLLAFSLWMMLCVGFSFWRGGSLRLVFRDWSRSLLAFLAVAALIRDLRQMRRAFYVLAAAVFLLALISLTMGTLEMGRLQLPQGKFDNPNDLAQVLLMGLPFWWFVVIRARPLHKILAIICTLPLFISILKTGSRAGLVGFGILFLLLFLRSSIVSKIGILVAGTLVVFGAAIFMPTAALQRYTTLFHPEKEAPQRITDEDSGDEYHMRALAAASAEKRQQMLIESIRLTFEHPVFGVGPFMFAAVENEEQKKQGGRGSWLGTHNAYTQVSSETGLPGLALYLAILVGCLRTCSKLEKFSRKGLHPQSSLIESMAFCLKASLLSYAATTLFSHVAYQSFLPVLAGLTVVLVSCAGAPFQEWQRAQRTFRPPNYSPARRAGADQQAVAPPALGQTV